MDEVNSTDTTGLAPSATSAGVTGLRRILGRAVRAGRRGAEALLHPHRQRKALRVARAHSSVPRVVIVCLGNICRSPYAEASFRQMISRDGGRQVEIVSAGLIGPGRMVPEESLAVAGPLAAALRRHESRLLTPAMLRCGDLAIVMAPGMSGDVAKALGYSPPTLILGDLDPSPWHGRAIADPWGHPAKEFTRAFARIDRCLEALAAEWQRR